MPLFFCYHTAPNYKRSPSSRLRVPACRVLSFLGMSSMACGCPGLGLPPDGEVVDPTPMDTAALLCVTELEQVRASGYVNCHIARNEPSADLWASFAAQCRQQQRILARALVAQRYLCLCRYPEWLCKDGIDAWLWTWACVPDACKDVFGEVALPRYIEWRAVPRKIETIPPAGPCAVSFGQGVDNARCLGHLEIALNPICKRVNAIWRMYANRHFLTSMFGSQIRSLPATATLAESGTDGPDYVAIWHFDECQRSGFSFFEMQFKARTFESFHLGACLPILCPDAVAKWWMANKMSELQPDAEIDRDGFEIVELAHRRELDLHWAIIGLNRCGSTSLASWLDKHPNLNVLTDPGDAFMEGGAGYLLKRLFYQRLIPKTEVAAVNEREAGIYAGIKEPFLLRSPRGRQMLAEMTHTRFIIVVKDWLDWLKSNVLFTFQGRSQGFDMGHCITDLARSVNRSDIQADFSATPFDCSVNWGAPMVVNHVRDLQALGVKKRRIKIVHLEMLRQERSPMRIARWLGVKAASGNQSNDLQIPFPREASIAPLWAEQSFFEEICKLPDALANNLERARRAATRGLAALLRNSGEGVPPSLQEHATLRVRTLSCARVGVAVQ